MTRTQLSPDQEQQILQDLQKKADQLTLKQPSKRFLIMTFAIITLAFAAAMIIGS